MTIRRIYTVSTTLWESNRLTVLKTASMYLRAAKTDAEEAGEATDGMANSVSELRDELLTLTKGKVDIMLDDTTFKSTIQIYRELAAVWNELSDIDAANILELIGGKRNATANASLLSNFKDVEAALTTSANSAGSALAENEKFLASIQGRLDIFKATFEEFSASFIDTELVNFVLTLGTGLLNLLTLLDKLHLLLPSLVASITLLAARKKALQMQESISMVNTLASSIIKEKGVTDTLATSVALLSAKEKSLLATQIEQAVTSGTISAELGSQIVGTLGLAGAEGTLTVANKTLGASFKSLMASIPVWGWIALGISAVIEVVIPLVDWIKSSTQSLDDLNTEWNELSNTIQNSANDFKNLKSEADDVIPRFVELAEGVDQFGNKVSLTDDEYAEFLELNNKIAEMFPELNMGMDSNGNAMLALSYSADTLADSLWNVVEAEREAANEEIAKTMPDVVDNITDTTAKYKKQIKAKQDALDEWNDFVKNTRDELYHGENAKIEDRFIDEEVIAYAEAIGVAREDIQDLIEYVDDSDYSGHYNADKVFDSAAVKNAVATVEKDIKNLQDNIQAKWKQLNPVITAWIQTDFQYQDLDSEMQTLATRMMSALDFQELNLKDDEAIKKYISDNIISPIHDAEPEVQNALTAAFSLKDLFDDGTINAGEYKTTIDKILSDLKDAGLSDTTIEAIKVSLDTEDFEEKLTHVKDLLSDEFDDEVNSLSSSDIELAYQIKADKGSMTFDELQEKLDELRFQNAPMVNVLDFSDMTKGLDSAKNGMDNLINAMSKLKSGTALTKQELAQLALEYPKLLEASNIFTDGSIQGQKNMLNTILDMQEQEYDAEIDKKIAELEATEQVLQDQLDLETQKANLIQEIKNIEANGILGQEQELVAKIGELNDLQGKNYVSMQDGVLTVNQEALNKHLDQDEDFGEKSATNIWSPFAKTIKTAHTKGFSAALTAANSYGSKLASWAKNIGSNVLSGLANAVKDALSGEWKGLKSYFSGVSTNISAPDVTVTFDGGSAYVGNQSVSDWVSEQEKASNERIAQTEELLQKTINAKNNLAKLKGLDLADIYGNSSDKDKGSDKDKEVDEYIAEVDRYAEALQKIKDIEQEQAKLERDLENADGAFEKVEIQKRLNKTYADKQNALHELNNLRDTTIKNTIPQLEALGFQIEYNDETNRLYIANLEHLNELQADSAGEYETGQEATNALRKETEELINDITDLNEENGDSSEEWLSLADAIKEGKDNIVDYLNEAVTEAIDFVSAMQDVYDTLKDAADEYAESGSITVDTLKTITEYGAEYLSYLKDENGQLVINKDRINDVIAARTKQLAVDTALSYVEKIRDALNEGKIKELNRLITATEQASDATWGLVYSELALLDLDGSQYKSALDNVNKLRSLSESAVKSIYSQADDDSASAMENKKDALDTILDLTMDLIKYEKDQEVEALEDQIEKYQKIIDLKKESLNSSKEENDYNKEVAAKVKEIATLQARINQLSLDDSREAQVERKSLEEELADLQTELADYQADYSLDKQTEALDDELAAYEETKNEEIEIVEKSVSSTEKLYQLAIDRITNDWDNLYDDIIAWNYDAGSTIESEIVSAWELASKAVQEYGSYLEAVNKIAAGESADNLIVSDSNNYGDPKSIINQMKSNSLKWLISDTDTQRNLNAQNKSYKSQLESLYGYNISYDDSTGSYINADTGKALYSIGTWEAVDYITQAMYKNSQAWSSASNSEKADLEKANERMAGYIADISGQKVWKDANGVWYIGNDELYKSYGFIYHNGGVVGDNGDAKDNEVLALLEKGELVLDQQKKDSLYKYMDVSTYMMEKFGAAINNLSAVSSVNPQLIANGFGNLEDKTGALTNISGKSTNYVIESIQVTAPIQVLQKLDEDAIREYSKTIGDISAKYIQEGFTRKGITPNTTLF